MAASSSKLLALTLSSSFLRSCRLASASLLPAPSRRLPGPLFSLRFCSAAVDPSAVDVPDSAAAALSSGHPWPEWGDFLEMLRAKGYFERAGPASGMSAGEGAAGDEEAAAAAEKAVASADTYPSRDLNRVKNACLKFARERFDLLRVIKPRFSKLNKLNGITPLTGCPLLMQIMILVNSLPKQDIQAIVERGCPNIHRKAVNSAKRLRKFVQVEEDDACNACKLRGSCDKAHLVPEAEEGVRTVDVVRILLSYAIDPVSLSGEKSVDGSVQESARKLLSQLATLSDTAIDPSLPKPVFQTSSKESLTKLFAKSRESVDKARGSFGSGKETVTEMKKGDWLCPNCNFLNFARNRRCLECKADGPKKIEAANTDMKMGDWICTQCHFMNFSRNKICFKCEEPRPKRQLNPGEWECPSCDFLNFRRNKLCKKCNHDRPEDDSQGFNDLKEDDDDGSPYKEIHKQVAKLSQRRTPARRRSGGFVDREDSLLTAKRRSAEDDEDDDILPYEGVRKHVVSKRATPAQRRFTAARNH
ncbi:hypothetical protein ACP70R_025273 [Stipagrostis hirtigluma subsp. patula]